MGKRLAALCLTAAVAMTTRTAWASGSYEPWSNVNGEWISADGRSVIQGVRGRGVTISKYQNRAGLIDWKKMAADQISFVMVRLGFMDDMDEYFDVNMRSAEREKLDLGVIFYGEAATREAARKEAEYVLEQVKDYRVTYPIGYSLSPALSPGRTISKRQMADLVNEFTEVVEEAGYRAALYGDHEWLSKSIDISRLSCDIWYSRFGVANDFPSRTIWRCTESGHVDGVPGSVCLEFCFEDYSQSFDGNGWRKINGTDYYFQDYSMVRGVTTQIDGDIYFFDRYGRSHTLSQERPRQDDGEIPEE